MKELNEFMAMGFLYLSLTFWLTIAAIIFFIAAF